ncbi:MAG TPA: hypothetical protein VLS90_03180 [Thermodesulfobacteriota bacterium]|nr:hypothetical protein [Thermodesulfobacteriota bacterium]
MDKTLGQILVEKEIMTPSQLDLALRRQKQEPGKYLGQILIEMGFASQEQINYVLNVFDKRKRIGEILLDLQVIGREQLETALGKQSELARQGVRKPLGLLILELQFAAYENYLKALSRHFNMPVVSLENFLPTAALQRALGEKFAAKNRIVVLENTPARIRLAMAEPTQHLMEEIRKALSPEKRIEFYLANPIELDQCLKKKLDPFYLSKLS